MTSFPAKDFVTAQRMYISGSDLKVWIWQPDEFDAKIGMPDRHTLIIKSDTDTLLNDTYEMTVDTIFNQMDYANDYLVTRVHLKSENKTVDFSRSQTRRDLSWPETPYRKGRP